MPTTPNSATFAKGLGKRPWTTRCTAACPCVLTVTSPAHGPGTSTVAARGSLRSSALIRLRQGQG